MLRIFGLVFPLQEEPDFFRVIQRKLKIKKDMLRGWHLRSKKLVWRSGACAFEYIVDVEVPLELEEKILNNADYGVARVPEKIRRQPVPGEELLVEPPVIVGAGVAGYYAGLTLARAGYAPVLVERGPPMVERETDLLRGEGGFHFWTASFHNPPLDDPYSQEILDELVSLGAPESVSYETGVCLGADVMNRIWHGLQKKLQEAGGVVHPWTEMEDIIVDRDMVKGIKTNKGSMSTPLVVLATGQRAPGVLNLLAGKGVNFTPALSACGVRIEHPQKLIDEIIYRQRIKENNLPPASYNLNLRFSREKRTVYSYRDIPEGRIVSCSPQEGYISTSAIRDGYSGGNTAAIVISLHPYDYPQGALGGLDFINDLERRAYEEGQERGLPAQLLDDFIVNQPSRSLEALMPPTYRGELIPANLNRCLPKRFCQHLKGALSYFEKHYPGFYHPQLLLTGVESRVRMPVAVQKKYGFCVEGLTGLMVTGEVAGCPGSFLQLALTGIKAGEYIISRYRPSYC